MQFLTQDKDFLKKVDESNFFQTALGLYQNQYLGVEVYRNFVDHFFAKNYLPSKLEEFPFLPIAFFKSHKIYNSSESFEAVFLSSGSTSDQRSRHEVANLDLYEQSFALAYNSSFGDPQEHCLMALLPSYQEQGNSSLVYMTKKLIEKSGHDWSGFYLNEKDLLIERLKSLISNGQKTVLIGVTFALLELAENHTFSTADNLFIIETGGMKGRREEITRNELHSKLRKSFPEAQICSEYGMTELLSQAYAKDSEIFNCQPWMKVMVRDVTDPKQVGLVGKRGGINVIDLANKYSCSFIQTDDLGVLFEDSSFEVLGRMDNSDIRGCSQLT